MALAVSGGPGGVARVEPQRLASWRHPGPVTALQARPPPRSPSRRHCKWQAGTVQVCSVARDLRAEPPQTAGIWHAAGGGFRAGGGVHLQRRRRRRAVPPAAGDAVGARRDPNRHPGLRAPLSGLSAVARGCTPRRLRLCPGPRVRGGGVVLLALRAAAQFALGFRRPIVSPHERRICTSAVCGCKPLRRSQDCIYDGGSESGAAGPRSYGAAALRARTWCRRRSCTAGR